ncbi:hypothetical protein [Ammoniphilus sp. YIM 78166]|uniref:hypothetical protein n=1 Tax=Ammoniphilus sp. YIM 78166 TaxID=1644106 RepID=UPI00106FE4BE|nr:hypothetical protein [Ammoniphilus sp. YIM 78166]
MISHGFTQFQESKFKQLKVDDKVQMGQWLHVYISFQVDTLPEGLSEPSALIILNQENDVVQMVVQDEGCDSEFKFTEGEQQQLTEFLREQGIVKE